MGSNSLKEYLKRYESNPEEGTTNAKKKKKQKKKKPQTQATGLVVVDEDPVWQKPVDLGEENSDNSSDEEKPVVDEDIEVKRMRRLEQLRARRHYHAISEDGSGWVSLSPKYANSNNINNDMSPPHKGKIRNGTPSPEPELNLLTSNVEDTDLSPPRQHSRRYDTPSPEHASQLAHNQAKDSDLSPPRKQRAHSVTLSPARKFRPSDATIEDADLSPPRQRRKDYGKRGLETAELHDISPPRRGHHDSLYQVSSHKSLELDLSPPRKRRNIGGRGLSDRSPSHPRSPPARVISHPSLSPDLSPPRKKQKEVDFPSSMKNQKTGLISGRDVREEIDKKKKDDWLRFKQMDPNISGRGAEPVYRDKIKGERISKEEYMKSKQKIKEKPKEMEIEWGKGLAQKREADARLQELELEKDRPFARTRDDPELDSVLKDRVRWGDPMAHLVKKKYPAPVIPDLGDNDRMRDSGFIVPQDIPDHSWLKRGLDAAPNRYGIRPGRHWDGVDRSNGFEKELFKRMNEKRSRDKEAYLWSVSDM
ncbi:BUD13 homolog isoform X2 [Neltuma alba]|uniref:BUD13 homolog isoform X2 n=1 Tax=Neltuma alba TaxID=207710 RepID=UPI0010A2BBA3|nr:BUD13 homolog isoform X2 [Prosopis alba]